MNKLVLACIGCLSLSLVSSTCLAEETTSTPAKDQAASDRAVHVTEAETNKAIDKLISQAKQGLPQVKERYVKGLLKEQNFFITTPIFDSAKNQEHVFVKVLAWQGDKLTGVIGSKVNLKGPQQGDKIEVNESDVEDWTIINKDGSQEGNLVGNYLSSLKH
jgi:uncharacterized protein YegJ (DUF2314 family)